MSQTALSTAIRIVVVDDHPLMREGVISTLQRDPNFCVVAEGSNADDAVRLTEDLLPDVLLLDMNMPGGGLTALRRVAASCPAVGVLVITVRDDEETVSEALQLGARGYVLKGISGSELIATIHAIHRGEHYVSPSLAARLLGLARGGDIATTRDSAIRLKELTVREEQILRLLSKGMSNKQIGGELSLSEKTVKHYMTNILQKLQVSNRVEAALLAHEAGKPGER